MPNESESGGVAPKAPEIKRAEMAEPLRIKNPSEKRVAELDAATKLDAANKAAGNDPKEVRLRQRNLRQCI